MCRGLVGNGDAAYHERGNATAAFAPPECLGWRDMPPPPPPRLDRFGACGTTLGELAVRRLAARCLGRRFWRAFGEPTLGVLARGRECRRASGDRQCSGYEQHVFEHGHSSHR